MHFITRFILLLFPVVAFSQQGKYKNIMDNVQKNISKNYDSMICLHTNYHEFVYIDSTKEIISVVHLDALSRKSSVGLASKYKTAGEYLYSGSIYGNKNLKNCGYSSAFEMFYGGNTYSYSVASCIITMHTENVVESRKAIIASQNKKPTVNHEKKIKDNTPCAIRTKIKKNNLQYEVKDTVYNSINCFLLILRQNSLFTLDDADRKNKKQRVASNWDTCYQTTVTTYIVNKSDYAILSSNYQTSYRNTKNEIRKFFLISKYEKSGNYYYEKVHEFKYPRLFLGFPDGFNNRDLYTLIIKETAPEYIQNPEKELKNISPIKPYEKYINIIEPVHIVDNNIQKKWNSYWE
jgi:hypothetical protein